MAEVDAGAVAPEVPVAVETAPTPEPTVSPEAEVEKQPEPPKTLTQEEVNKIVAREKAQVARRVERETRERARLEFERDALKQQLEAHTKPAQTPGKPDPKDFADFEAWVDAVADWKLDQKLAARETKTQQETQEQAAVRQAQAQYQFVQDRFLSPGAEKYGDEFKDAVLSMPMSPAMLNAFAESDVGADIAWRLYQNPAEAKRIFALPPTRQAIELGKIEDQIKAPPKPTQTPAPIVPNGSRASVSKDLEKMTDKEYAEYRRKQKANRRG